MPLSIADKLKIKEGFALLAVNAPGGFIKSLGKLPAKVSILTTGKDYDQVHWFVKDKKELDKQLAKIIKLVKDGVTCWVYYPKGSSGIQTDLTRDKGWDELLRHTEFQWLSLISFNETWSTFAFRLKTAADKSKDAAPKQEREILKYIDPSTMRVFLPEDLAQVFKQHKKEAAFFDSLAYSHKKEYIEWIVTAKRPETRENRLAGIIEKLAKSSKEKKGL